jgi:hypothetical protein
MTAYLGVGVTYDRTADPGGVVAGFFLIYKIQVVQQRISTIIPFFSFIIFEEKID